MIYFHHKLEPDPQGAPALLTTSAVTRGAVYTIGVRFGHDMKPEQQTARMFELIASHESIIAKKWGVAL